MTQGFITHSRNPHNQQLNFHFGYGGFYKYYLQRYWINFVYKKVVRPLWPAALFYFFFGWAGMRAYDNAVYDYFYFFDAKNEGHH